MRFRFNRLGVVVLVALSVVLAGCEDEEQAPSAPAAESGSAAGATDRAEWQVASVFSSTLPVLGETGRSVAERIALLSGGRIKLQLFDPGKLVPPLEVLAAVGAGTVDAGWSVPGSWFDRMPAVAFFSSPPFGADVAEYLAWLYEGQGLSLWRELYAEQGVVPVPCGYVPPEAAGWSREPLDNVGALKGRKLHQFGLGGLVLQKLGATVHLLAAEDIYPALERAVLDGAQISVPSIDAKLGFPKVAKHYYFPGWHQQASVQELLVNQARWDALGDAERALVETVCRAAMVTGMARAEVAQSKAVAGLKKQGVEIHYWRGEELQAFRAAYDEVLKEMRIRDENFKRVHDAYRAFRKDFAEWAALSRLPRGF